MNDAVEPATRRRTAGIAAAPHAVAPSAHTPAFHANNSNSMTTRFSLTARPTLTALAAALAALANVPAFAQPPGMPSPAQLAAAERNRSVSAGDAWIVDRTTTLDSLRLEPGASIAAPAGHSLTMTVDGVETGFRPGLVKGRIVLTVTDEVAVKFSPLMTHHFRQALFLDANGVVPSKSVTSAAGGFLAKDGVLSGASVRSKGENFNGVYVTGGTWTLKDLVLDFEGNGGNDFAGYGAGVMSDGKDTTLIVDNAKVSTHGAVRTTVIANGGSNLIVKNSTVASKTGVLPADYRSNVTPGEMKDAPWMLGIKGNVRATNVLGDRTTATYINTRLSSDGWGVLSIDASQDTKLTAIDSEIDLQGASGYGTYAIGNSTNSFYGSSLRVPTFGAIITGGHAVFASSSAANVAKVDADVHLHLSPQELAALPVRQTTVESRRFGVMMWGDATVRIADGTVFDTGEAVFLDKGAASRIDVDGSGGARLNARNGVIFQAIDNDDPGPQMVEGLMLNTGVFHDPAEAPARIAGFDLAAEHKTDMVASFSHIQLKGDFYNAIRSIAVGGGMTPDGGMRPPTGKAGSNLILAFADSGVTGRITAASAKHRKPTITPADYEWLAEVVNTPAPAINNGVVVSLKHSTWTVTGKSYLSSLTLDEQSSIVGADRRAVKLTVDGVATPLKPGSYKGAIVLSAGG